MSTSSVVGHGIDDVILRLNMGRLLRPAAIALKLAVLPVAGFAEPSDVAAQVAAQLGTQGYRQIEVQRSLLGKVVINARGNGHTREIVIDPRNGDLLRDLIREDNRRDSTVTASVGTRDNDSGDDDGSTDNADDSGDDDSSDDSDSDSDHADDDSRDSDDSDSESDDD